MPLLETRNLTAFYGDFQALYGIDTALDKGETIAIGPGKVSLLEAVRKHGSISAAARSLDMSYRRAWLLIDELNRSLKSPATISEQGGQSGGGGRAVADPRAVGCPACRPPRTPTTPRPAADRCSWTTARRSIGSPKGSGPLPGARRKGDRSKQSGNPNKRGGNRQPF